MYGAFIGDIVGSKYKFSNIHLLAESRACGYKGRSGVRDFS